MQKKKCFECGCELDRDSSGSWSDDTDLVMRDVEFCTDDLEYILSMAYDDQSWDREDEEDLDIDKVSNFIIEYVKNKKNYEKS